MDNRDPQWKGSNIAPDSYSNARLACPFYRNCPAKYQKYRSCAGPGWSTVHRVKEHILRQHAPPIQCVRCSALFATDTELNKHLTLPAPCPLRIPTSQSVGFNKEQEKALRKRGRGPAEKQWQEMYKILFPFVPEELIPSPRYESSIGDWEKRRRRDLDQMENYLRLELTREVKRRLEQKNLKIPQPLETQVRRQVIEIIESAQVVAFQSYRRQVTRPMETHDPETDGQPFDFNSAPQSQTSYGSGLAATLEAPTFPAMTEGAHGLSTPTAAVNLEPSQQASGAKCDFDSSVGSQDELGPQNDDAGWMGNLDLDVDFINWNFEREN